MSVWESMPQFQDRLLRSIGEGAVDGVLSASATETDAPLLRQLAQRTPVVLLNRTIEGAALDQVTSNNFGGAEAVAAHFVKGGRRRCGLLTGHSHASTIREREGGFRAGLADAGLQLRADQQLSVQDFSYQCGYEGVQALLARAPDLEAIFCCNDVLAIGACDGARAMGRLVPRDVWVIGFDDIPMAGWDAINLSTVRQPLNVMARLAVQKLAALLDGSAAEPETIRLHNELLVRGTSG